MADQTPMMKQYNEIKAQHRDCILMFRLGDFYEMFSDDAVIAAKELGITLTSRDKTSEEKTPMCGVPYHAVEGYIAKLIEKGYKVAICDQVEDPKTAKGVVRREVTKVLTPGTVTDGEMLDDKSNNFLAVIYKEKDRAGAAFADVSTGELYVTEIGDDEADMKLLGELSKYSPREVLINKTAIGGSIEKFFKTQSDARVEGYDGNGLDYNSASEALASHFKVKDIGILGIEGRRDAVFAVYVMLLFLQKNNKNILGYIRKLGFYYSSQYMDIDVFSRRNLELLETMRRQNKTGSLYWVLDRTGTSMGARLLKAWIEKPLIHVGLISKRLFAVLEFTKDLSGREHLMDLLKSISDLSRIMSKVIAGTVNCRDLISLKGSLKNLPEIKEKLSYYKTDLLVDCYDNIDDLQDLCGLIDAAIVDEPPAVMSKINLIKSGYDEEIDRYRSALTEGKHWIKDFEAAEREKTGIRNLKVGFNKVFGYYIEVSKGNVDKVPEGYERRQTLANCERYINYKLKELETLVLTAEEHITVREQEIFGLVCGKVAQTVDRVQKTTDAVAVVDVLLSLADVAVKNNYVMPTVDISDVIDIKDGRHPVVEKTLKDELFVPNNAYLDLKDNLFAIITGPNMAGKSTYMRQVAVITLMAQIGSFVPASYCRIGIVDKIFTRVGASDDLALGQSTFMVEMTEMANILKNATKKSLIILDEIGRGTSTYDGLSIAWSVVEYISAKKNIGARTLFATHYHELTQLEDKVDGVKNYCIVAKKRGDDVIFLRKIAKGGADDSYGIEVAALAGVPGKVIKRAKEILERLENGEHDQGKVNVKTASEGYEDTEVQVGVLDFKKDEIIEELKNAELAAITPIEALNKLYQLQKKAEEL